MSTEELRPEIAGIDAKVYPGMFEDEVQATIKIDNQEITVLASKSDVVMDGPTPTAEGTPGKLKVYLVDASPKGFLVDLPGEALGSTKRVRISSTAVHRM
jgi:hypothetical protein